MWTGYIPKVIVPNLASREDRFSRICDLLYDYGISADIWDAIPHEKGYLGLVMTMKAIFKHCLEKGYERVLVLEDDCDFLCQPELFHETLDKCCDDLRKINWDLFYLGLQHPQPFESWITPNILLVKRGFSTHSVLYSKSAMGYFLSAHIDQPIDNFWVNSYQKYNTSFCSYPMLCSQVEGHSDIGGQYISWKPFLEKYFDKFTKDILPQRFKTKQII